jgi:hypothetical protein
MDLIAEYKATLEAYTQMVTQMKLNRGGDPTVLRLLRMKLERLVKTIQSGSPSDAPAPPDASQPTLR